MSRGIQIHVVKERHGKAPVASIKKKIDCKPSYSDLSFCEVSFNFIQASMRTYLVENHWKERKNNYNNKET